MTAPVRAAQHPFAGTGQFCTYCGQSRRAEPHGKTERAESPAESGPVIALVSVEKLLFHPKNIRRDLGDLRELAASIKSVGLLQPLLLHKTGGGLQIVDGHRRCAAARQAGVRKLPAMVVDHLDDDEVIVRALETVRLKKGIDHEERRAALISLRDTYGYSIKLLAEQFAVTEGAVYAWLRPEKTEAGNEKRHRPNQPNRRLNATKLRSVLADWRDRPLTDDARELLAAVEALLPEAAE